MAHLIGICGESGHGKSYGVRNMDPGSTAIIGTTYKPIPIKGWKKKYLDMRVHGEDKGNYLITDDPQEISKAAKYISQNRPEIKSLVIDDFQYTMSNQFMRRAKETGFEKFTDIGTSVWRLLNELQGMRDDLKVFILTHSEVDQIGKRKMKTIGKLLDDKITLEGLFTYFLYAESTENFSTNKVEYHYITNNDGSHPAKSPPGVFPDLKIPNDINYVAERIEAFEEGEEEDEESAQEQQDQQQTQNPSEQ